MTMFSRAAGTGRAASDHGGGSTFGEQTRSEAAFRARLGADLYRRGLYARAAQEFRGALAADPGDADIHNHLAIALNAQGLYEEAIRELRQALTLSPAHAEAARNLARTLSAVGAEEGALLASASPPGRLPN